MQAVRDCNLRKLHELVNMWINVKCTPTEFTRANSIGKKTVTCSIRNVADAQLIKKLDKALYSHVIIDTLLIVYCR